jgi:hypothetical protein
MRNARALGTTLSASRASRARGRPLLVEGLLGEAAAGHDDLHEEGDEGVGFHGGVQTGCQPRMG